MSWFKVVALVALSLSPTARGAAGPVPAVPPTPASRAAAEEHGKIAWFQGTLEQALVEAQKKQQPLFVDLWTSWCGWCKRLDATTYSDDSVVLALKGFVCVNIDAESEAGAPIARRFAVRGYPALIVLDADGTKRAQIGGYLAPADFKREIARVRALGSLEELRAKVVANPADADARWALARRLTELGDAAGAQRETDALLRIDPQGKTQPMHWLAFEQVITDINSGWEKDKSLDTAQLAKFLAVEPFAEVRFEGWKRMNQMKAWQAGTADTRGQADAARALRAEARGALLEMWKDVPKELTVRLASDLAQAFWKERRELSEAEKTALLAVANGAHAGASDDPAALDALACALHVNGKPEEALAQVKRALEIDPAHPAAVQHEAEFRAGG